MTEPKPPRFKNKFLFGIRTGEKNKTYTLSVDACSSSEAIKELKAALMALENRNSHFAEGENNVMMIGNVAATSGYKPSPSTVIPVSADQSRREAGSAVPRTVFPLPHLP